MLKRDLLFRSNACAKLAEPLPTTDGGVPVAALSFALPF
jgi:hypothetical protein